MNECTPPFVSLPFVSLAPRLVVRFDAETDDTHTETTKHAFVTRCTRVVVFSKEHSHVSSARVGMNVSCKIGHATTRPSTVFSP